MEISEKSQISIPRMRNVCRLLRKGHFSVLFREFLKRLRSESLSLGLRRDMKVSFQAPEANIKLQIRLLKDGDLDELLVSNSQNPVDPRLIARQCSLAEAEISHCYVAVTPEDKPCYMQWLISDNEIIERNFKGLFPLLKKYEALLEGAYCNPAYRGMGIMPAAMAQIAEKSDSTKIRWINTFVDVTNIPSLKGCRRAGFEPCIMRKDRWFFFYRMISFHPVSEEIMEEYELNTNGKLSAAPAQTYSFASAENPAATTR